MNCLLGDGTEGGEVLLGHAVAGGRGAAGGADGAGDLAQALRCSLGPPENGLGLTCTFGVQTSPSRKAGMLHLDGMIRQDTE